MVMPTFMPFKLVCVHPIDCALTHNFVSNTDTLQQVLIKCDLIERPRLIALATSDPQPIRTILASLCLPAHVTDTAMVLVDGKVVAGCFALRPGVLPCVRVLCGRLQGGSGINGTCFAHCCVSALTPWFALAVSPTLISERMCARPCDVVRVHGDCACVPFGMFV